MKKDSFPMNKNIVIQKTKLQIRITELIILDQNVDNKEKTKTCKFNIFKCIFHFNHKSIVATVETYDFDSLFEIHCCHKRSDLEILLFFSF